MAAHTENSMAFLLSAAVDARSPSPNKAISSNSFTRGLARLKVCVLRGRTFRHRPNFCITRVGSDVKSFLEEHFASLYKKKILKNRIRTRGRWLLHQRHLGFPHPLGFRARRGASPNKVAPLVAVPCSIVAILSFRVEQRREAVV